MYLIVNGSVEPFCIAIINTEAALESFEYLPNDKSLGDEIFNFLEQNQALLPNLQWVGGISGPGGFSTLRTVSLLLQSLAFRWKIPIKQTEAFDWIAPWAKAEGYDHFVLNSFSGKVFFDRELRLLEEVRGTNNTWFASLPVVKRPKSKEQKNPSIESLFMSLKEQKDQTSFIPAYYFEALDS